MPPCPDQGSVPSRSWPVSSPGRTAPDRRHTPSHCGHSPRDWRRGSGLLKPCDRLAGDIRSLRGGYSGFARRDSARAPGTTGSPSSRTSAWLALIGDHGVVGAFVAALGGEVIDSVDG